MTLVEKIQSRQAYLCVIGLGYVGLPLLAEFANAGFKAIGIDIDENKVKSINDGQSYIGDVSSKIISKNALEGNLRATTDFSFLAEADTVNICVPTPLRKTRDPDISYIVSAVEEIAKYIHKEQLIVLESTTYPGTTEEVILPMLEESGLKVGEGFYLAFSPERVDPGNAQYTTRNIPKVVGGVTPKCTEAASALYSATLSHTVPVRSAKAAETVKLLENTFRSVNIGLVNEIALMCNKMGIDVWEVIEAAATKPFGFMPFYPGPGLGGHCIPIDPFYLSWKAKLAGFEARFIELAGQINGSMPEYVVQKISDALNRSKKSVNGSRILILGVSYKENIDDVRESPALDVIRLLRLRGADVVYHDPLVKGVPDEIDGNAHIALTPETVSECDCAAIITGHRGVDYQLVLDNIPILVDTRNVMKGHQSDKIVKL
ncbi:MAG: nucleotide sugar dehydrogenase [Candidatus Latescibacteria bacterium]|nr:nucleotide sugar dehydrogenase [Candidatus Latescibacterota bacterium]NIM21510.1 nucleotide sugar dehydrogenase [Candidatus Latescibacterota bacterium]NIM65681.1 nucleotide sugar dehydrogenase [Candidatus Latescibacterota bacterium]NIO02063.1 nucleotide sugar dehydrogenase [Candidatus Latescibacterota bacterium]NIO28875.1 nucleotide sugar dehydrogenase [Candidatus Latescibacterota bacterium]